MSGQQYPPSCDVIGGTSDTKSEGYFRVLAESRSGIDSQGGQGSLAEADMSNQMLFQYSYLCVPGASKQAS